TLSITGFVARGAAALANAAWVRSRAARTLPHIVDTVLLVSAITLAWTLRLNPLTTPWLGAKIVGLLAYIALGMLALKPTRPRGVRIAAWLAALVCFAQIVATAITKSALGLLALV
ncbi:MAG: SirB2 family protein, partial [Proteobacteria bacterium]|nr:SirB2 family protein [Pseudomonadota bacterium]